MTNGKVIRLLVDDSPFDIRYGELLEHERRLDFRSGILTPHGALALADRQDGAGHLRTARLLLPAGDHGDPLHGRADRRRRPASSSSRSWSTNEPRPAISKDPRAAAALEAPLEVGGIHGRRRPRRARPPDQGVEAAGGGGDGPRDRRARRLRPARDAEAWEDLGRLTINATPAPGEPLTITKFVTYGWSARRSVPAMRDQVSAALAEARHAGWDELVADQRAYLDDFWERADVELDGDAELQQAIRFGLFHALQASARGEGRAIPAKGLTGPGYDGHTFWDTEAYVLPLLSYAVPEAAAEALKWRLATIEKARERAERARPRGRRLPLADDQRRRVRRLLARRAPPPSTSTPTSPRRSAATATSTTTRDFERDVGLPLLVETARLWRSLGHHDAHGAFRIDGVTGPDEYSAVADNNVYTNLLAQKNLRAAAEFAERFGDAADGARGRPRGDRLLARRGRGDDDPLRRGARRPPAGGELHQARPLGLRRDRRPTTTRCCSTTPTSTSTASRW